MIDDPILLVKRGGALELVAHKPAPLRLPWRAPFPNLDEQFAPYRWPTLCEAGDGIVYHRGGPLAGIPACSVCAVLKAAA